MPEKSFFPAIPEKDPEPAKDRKQMTKNKGQIISTIILAVISIPFTLVILYFLSFAFPYYREFLFYPTVLSI